MNLILSLLGWSLRLSIPEIGFMLFLRLPFSSRTFVWVSQDISRERKGIRETYHKLSKRKPVWTYFYWCCWCWAFIQQLQFQCSSILQQLTSSIAILCHPLISIKLVMRGSKNYYYMVHKVDTRNILDSAH